MCRHLSRVQWIYRHWSVARASLVDSRVHHVQFLAKMSVDKKYMDLYLSEVFKKFIQIQDEEYKKSQEVFNAVFEQVKQKMGENCNYFSQYSKQVLYAGSVYDGIKVSKLDEFDMDIVVRLPINYDQGEKGIILENDEPGFVRMKITSAFDNLDKQVDWEKRHKVTRDWRDAEKYFLQNKFRAWMQGIVTKAVNDLKGEVRVGDNVYLLTYKVSGPAFTLNVRNSEGASPFVLDVDLVPVIRFSYPRWPEGYRAVDGKQSRDWLVVPKPNKSMPEAQQNRCWRLSFQEFERDLMKGCQQLKITIRLIKKLRDALELKYIASYYIKTLFLWKIVSEEKTYWQNRISTLFLVMLEELHGAIEKKEILYFWNDKHNLIASLKPSLQKIYKEKLLDVINSVRAGDVERVVSYLLNAEELGQYRESEFYQQHLTLVNNGSLKRQISVKSVSSSNGDADVTDAKNPIVRSESISLKALVAKLDKLADKFDKMSATLTDKIDLLTDKVDSLAETVAAQAMKVDRMESKEKVDNVVFDLLGGTVFAETSLN